MTTKAQEKAERREAACEMLRDLFPRDSRVSLVLAHVSRSGMQRGILVLAQTSDGVDDVSWMVARAVDWPLHREAGVRVDGCGMDMGFHLVYTLAHVLYGDGYALQHRWI